MVVSDVGKILMVTQANRLDFLFGFGCLVIVRMLFCFILVFILLVQLSGGLVLHRQTTYDYASRPCGILFLSSLMYLAGGRVELPAESDGDATASL